MKGLSHAYPFSVIAGAILGVILASTSAAAEHACEERNTVLGHLAQKYGEAPVAIGVTTRGGLVELLRNIKDDTWTIIVTTPQGMSCLVAAGEGWRNMVQIDLEPEA